MNTQQFIDKAKEVHGSKYDYSKTKYINCKTKILIICPIHKEFEQYPNNHLKGHECKLCSINNTKQNVNDFINKANKFHNYKYDYSNVSYINSRTKVAIICPEHGIFYQTPSSHLRYRCPYCNNSKIPTNEEFIKSAKLIHNNKYDYSKTKYIKSQKYIEIICPIHGIFKQTPNSHLIGHGCPKCGKSLKLLNEEFIKRSNNIHNNKYDYSKTNYINTRSKITIICPNHGEFKQLADLHLRGHGCPKCVSNISSYHKEIISFLDSLNIKYTINNRDLINPYELDITISNNIAIEFHGLYWHSFNSIETKKEKFYHYLKHDLCIKNNIKLIQIFENEWIEKPNIIKSIINNTLNLSSKIYARKCSISKIPINNYIKFINTNHLYGYIPCTIAYGLYYNNELMCVMSFKKNNKYEWEISRFANKLFSTVTGGASKLLSKFIYDYNPNTIMTYADRRYSSGNLYRKLGFNIIKITNPNYFYVNHNKLFSRQQFQKHKLKNKLPIFNNILSESENMFNNGFRRIWDAGHYKFILNVNT